MFFALRGIVDQGVRRGKRHGRFLILGSASVDLLRQSARAWPGASPMWGLGPLDVLEAAADGDALNALWARGGFPDSFLARSDADSGHDARQYAHDMTPC